MNWTRMAFAARGSAMFLLVLAAAYFVSFTLGWVPPRPAIFATLTGALLVAVAAVLLISAARRSRGLVSVGGALAEILVCVGVLLVGGGGLANWLLSYQGFVVLQEREPVELSREGDLGAFESGPLARLGDLDLRIGLARLAFVPSGGGRFSVVSRVKVLDRRGEESAVEVAPGRPARLGGVVLRQGAFGFAPRLIVEVRGKRVLDEFVPFRTMREGPEGLAFLGDFEISSLGLRFAGAIALDDLNDSLRGHPALELTMERGGVVGRPMGLRPGQGISADEEITVTFLGLRRWSEIDFSRRTYPLPIWTGLGALCVGGLIGLGAAGRRWIHRWAIRE